MNRLEQLIIRFIEWYEPRLEHLKFMFSPMPTTLEYSLQADIISRKWMWYPNTLHYFDLLLREHYLPGCHKLINSSSVLWRKLSPDYIPMYWETSKLDLKRTVARMSRNGGMT